MSKKNVIKKSSLAPTVLISGGAGFIGYYLTEAFLEKGARVVVVDNISNLETNRVARFVRNPKFALFDVGSTGVLPPEIESVDYIIHVGDLEKYFVDKDALTLDTLLVNSQSIKALLDLSTKSSSKFLLLSTIDIHEDVDPTKVSSDYFGHTVINGEEFKNSDARKFAEAVVWEHSRRFGTNARIVRLPYLYGPKMSLDACGALGEMLRDLIHRKDITIYGDENRKEHYLYVDDAILGIVKSLFNPNTKGNTYSLVGEDSHKALTTAFLLRNLADRRTEIEFKDSAKSFINDIKVTNLYNLKDLDWWPKYSLKEGILNTLEHFGYHINVNAFKPNDLILEKEKEKALKTGAINTLFDGGNVRDVLDTVLPKSGTYFEEFSDPELPLTATSNTSLYKGILGKMLFFVSKLRNLKIIFTKSPAAVLSILAVFISALIIFVITPLFSFNSGIRDTYKSLQDTQQALYKLDVSEAEKLGNNANLYLTKSRSAFSKSKWVYILFLGSDGYTSLNNALISLSYFVKASNDLIVAFEPYSNLWEILHPESNAVLSSSDLEKSQTYIISANNEMQLARANFSYVKRDTLPKQLIPIFSKYETYLNKLSADLQILSITASDINSLLGTEGPKNYIIWFQNSNELRPTGGFIGSYGVLTLDKGKVIGLNIDDIYNPDGQIDLKRITVAPPKPIADLLAEDRMYLRNSNWSPDLSVSAKDFSNLYARVTGVTPDGIIAVDLNFVENLLDTLGPLYLASYDEEITADNLYERTQYHSDFNYQNGVSDKKDFLTVLGGKLLEKIFSLESNQLPDLFKNIYKSLNEKHLMISFNNNSANIFLEARNWNGNLISTKGDYLYVVNANLGGNKANYYVKSDYSYVVSSKTRDGLLRGVLNLHYKHTGRDLSWPGGSYKDYIRVLVQKGSKLTGATISYNGGGKENIFDKIISSSVGSYDDFEYYFILNPQEEVTISLEYDLPLNLSMNKSFKDYSLVWQKQAGTQNDTVSVEFNAPFGMEISSVDTNMSTDESSVVTRFSDILKTDKNLFIKMR